MDTSVLNDVDISKCYTYLKFFRAIGYSMSSALEAAVEASRK